MTSELSLRSGMGCNSISRYVSAVSSWHVRALRKLQNVRNERDAQGCDLNFKLQIPSSSWSWHCILRGYRRSWKSSSSVHRQKKPIRWGVRRLPKVEPIKDLRLQRPLLEQMRAVGPDVARGPTCSVDGEDDGDLEIIESESAGGVGRGASKTDRKPKRRRLIQLDHVRPPYYGDYGKDPPAR